MIEDVSGRKMELGLPGLPNAIKTERSEESAAIDVTASCQGQPSRIPFRSEKHSQTVLEGFAELRRNSELFDVTICVGSRRIQAHKAVLAASSVYFRGMFCGELSESRQREVTIHGVDEQAMETLINYCYSAEIVIEESNVQQLLPAACLLQLSEVQQSCSEFLKQQLDPSNVLGIRSFADTHACHDLMAVADRYALQNFTDVCASEEFLLLPKEQLVSLLRSDELNAHSEEQVYCAVMRWVRSSLSERRAQVGEVMSEVRLALLAPKFLVETVSVDPIIKRDDVCRDLVDEAKNYLLLADERARLDNSRTRPRKPARSNDILFAVGGWCSGDAINTVERYDEASGEWRMVTPMAKRRCGVGIAVLGDLLYAIGGHDGHSYLHTIERYDTRTNKWDSAADAGASPSGSLGVAPTSTSRTSVGVAVLEGHIYAVGGQDGVSCLNLVERYDPVANRWHKVAPMSTRRLGVGVVAHERVLYAIGGSDGTTPLSSVERYDPRVGRWQAAPAMNTRRKHLGVAVFDGCLFAVGGRDDTIELASAERFDVRAGLWQPVVSMTCRRSGVGLAVCNDRLLAIGGFDGTTYLKSVEQLDADASCWKHHSNMNYRRLGGGVGVVRGVQLNSIDPFGTPITVPHAHLAASASAAPLGS